MCVDHLTPGSDADAEVAMLYKTLLARPSVLVVLLRVWLWNGCQLNLFQYYHQVPQSSLIMQQQDQDFIGNDTVQRCWHVGLRMKT